MGKIVEISGYRFKTVKKRSRWQISEECKHRNITLDENGGCVICEDCKRQVSAFWALQMLVETYSDAWEEVFAANRKLQLQRAELEKKRRSKR